MNGLKSYGAALIYLIVFSCVDPFKLPELPLSRQLVVDGLITTDPGPHTVKLSSSATLNVSSTSPVTGATVSVLDDLGNEVFLNEINDGEYRVFPESWQAQIGRSYQLKIRLLDGRQYESTKQLVYTPGTIDSVYATHVKNAISPGDPVNEKDAFVMYVNSSGASGQPNFLRWRWTGTYEILAQPELITGVTPDGNRVPAPPPCSGFNSNLIPIGPCTCCNCWVSEFSILANVSENEFVNANRFYGVELMKIPIDGFRFYNKYHLQIEQLSMDESTYNFWKLVKAQQSSATNIFQPNVIRVQGNINNVDDSPELVLGVVSFASIARTTKVVYRVDIPGAPPPLPTLIMDCRSFDRTSTNVRPPFW